MPPDNPEYPTRYYVFIYRPGPKWLAGRPITAQPLGGHFEYMTRLERESRLVLGGGFVDDAGAMGVLTASSLADAQALIDGDPAVEEGVVVSEVHPWFVTVPGRIEASRPERGAE